MTSIASRPFNPRVAGIAPPPIPLAQSWLGDYDGSCGPALDLSQAVPGYPPHQSLLTALAHHAGSTATCGYGDIEGDAALRESYAAHLSALYAAQIGKEHVHITSGCNQAFFATMLALAGAGDTVLMSNPCYFNHDASLEMLGIRTERFDCFAENGFLPAPSDIENALHEGVRAVALVSPNNPTGAVYPSETLGEILNICRARNVWLVLDETYRDFLPADFGRPHDLFQDGQWSDGLVQLYSFSKSFCIPGHRVGAVTAGAQVVEQIAKVMDNLQICAPRAPQLALAETMDSLAGWRAENARRIAQRAEVFKKAIAEADGWEIAAIGAYFSYVRHPFGNIGSEAVALHLAQDRGVLALPGTFFGDSQEGYLRFAFANADSEALGQVSERLNGAAL